MASFEQLTLVIDLGDEEKSLAEDVLAEGGYVVTQHPDSERRATSDILGPVLQYVLPGVASAGLAARMVLGLIRGFGQGRIIELSSDAIAVTREPDLPRGTMVVRHDGTTVDIIDLTDRGDPLNRLAGLVGRYTVSTPQAPASPVLAVVADAIADDLAEAGLATVVPGVRISPSEAVLTIVGSAALSGVSLVAFARIPGIGPAIAERLVRSSVEQTHTFRLRATTPDGEIELDIDGNTDIGAVGDLIDRLHPRPRRGASPDDVARKVFVIHGRDTQVADLIFAVLQQLKLDTLEWEPLVQATGNPATSLLNAIAHGLAVGAVQAVVAVMTPDDVVTLHGQLHAADEHDFETSPRMQARPNVLLELGWALANYPEQTIILEFGSSFRPIADLAGLNVIRFNGEETAVKLGKLVGRLEIAGCPVDTRGTDWLRTKPFQDLHAYTRRP